MTLITPADRLRASNTAVHKLSQAAGPLMDARHALRYWPEAQVHAQRAVDELRAALDALYDAPTMIATCAHQ